MSKAPEGATSQASGSELRVCLIAALYMLYGLALLAWDARGTNLTAKTLLQVSQSR